MRWKPWNHQLLWRLKIESITRSGAEMEIFNPNCTNHPILWLTREMQPFHLPTLYWPWSAITATQEIEYEECAKKMINKNNINCCNHNPKIYVALC